MSSLWLIVEEVKPEFDHTSKGLAKRIKVVKSGKDAPVRPIELWSGIKYGPVFKVLYYAGARLSEIAGLIVDDLCEGRILIRPNIILLR